MGMPRRIKLLCPRPSLAASLRYLIVFGFIPAIFAAATSIATGSSLAITKPILFGSIPETMLPSIMHKLNFVALFMATIISSNLG